MFDNISPQVIVGLLSALLAAVVALGSVFLSNFNQRKLVKETFELNKKSEQAVFLRGKLEELNLLFMKWQEISLLRAFIYEELINGEINQSEAKMRVETLINPKQREISIEDNLQRIEVIINLFFPSLRNLMIEVINSTIKIPSDFYEINMPRMSVEEYPE